MSSKCCIRMETSYDNRAKSVKAKAISYANTEIT
nr:MAG TPA: hypothetical protein [Bacteriophage sp.]